MALPGLLPTRLPASSRWAIHATLLVMVALAVLLISLVTGLADAGPDSASDFSGWLWRWGKPM